MLSNSSPIELKAVNSALSCYNCGSNIFGDATYHADSTIQDESDIAHREVQRIDTLIQQLHQQRSHFLQKLNSIQSSTRSLPFEVLASIFQLACITEGYRRDHSTPMQLGAICSAWRQVVYSAPWVWKSLELKIFLHNCANISKTKADAIANNARCKAAILDFYLENVKTLPFSLDFTFSDVCDGDRELVDSLRVYPNSIMNVILDKGVRFGSLALRSAREPWIDSLSQSTNFQNLESLSLHFYEYYRELGDYDFSAFHGLRRLHLTGTNCGFFSFPGTNITSVRLHRVPVNFCGHLLFQCHNLVDYHCTEPSTPVDSGRFKPPTEIVVFPYLKTFEWHFEHDFRDQLILRYLELPALVSFRAMILSELEFEEEDIRRFTECISKNLSTLRIEMEYRGNPDAAFLKALLINSVNVKLFSLKNGHPNLILEIVSLLIPHSTHDVNPYLPMLQDFRLGFGASNLVSEKPIVEEMLLKLEGRGLKFKHGTMLCSILSYHLRSLDATSLLESPCKGCTSRPFLSFHKIGLPSVDRS